MSRLDELERRYCERPGSMPNHERAELMLFRGDEIERLQAIVAKLPPPGDRLAELELHNQLLRDRLDAIRADGAVDELRKVWDASPSRPEEMDDEDIIKLRSAVDVFLNYVALVAAKGGE